jgi:hypothetical protein
MALDPCCDVIIGGEIYITAVFNGPGAAGGQGQGGGAGRYEAMGEVRIQPSALERTAGASSAGAVWVTEVSRPVRAILTFANRCSNNPMRMYCERCKIHIDIVEKSRGVTHSMTDCVTVGLPEVNLNTGEISGIEIICAGTYTVEEAGNIEKQQCYKSYYNPMMGTFDQGSATAT